MPSQVITSKCSNEISCVYYVNSSRSIFSIMAFITPKIHLTSLLLYMGSTLLYHINSTQVKPLGMDTFIFYLCIYLIISHILILHLIYIFHYSGHQKCISKYADMVLSQFTFFGHLLSLPRILHACMYTTHTLLYQRFMLYRYSFSRQK